MSKTDPAYPYLAIAGDLRRRIRRGQWAPGDRLPSIRELERDYPQSRMTLYRALQHLAAHGYLSMTHGRGTFVRAAHVRKRIAILGGPHLFQQSLTPFMLQAFEHAHAALARADMDSQLYAEDPLSASYMPQGLLGELAGKKLAGLLTIDARFPHKHMASDAWREHAVPHVHIGTIDTPHRFYVDRNAFMTKAIRHAARRGLRNVALVERREHFEEDLPIFAGQCAAAGLKLVDPPDNMPSEKLSYEHYGFELSKAYWSARPNPQAMIIPDDVIAKGAAQAALALSIAVPDRCELIALTNRGSGMFYPVAMTCLEVNVEKIVTLATTTLIELIQGDNIEPRTVLVPPARLGKKTRQLALRA